MLQCIHVFDMLLDEYAYTIKDIDIHDMYEGITTQHIKDRL